jgi:hypothetical protein
MANDSETRGIFHHERMARRFSKSGSRCRIVEPYARTMADPQAERVLSKLDYRAKKAATPIWQEQAAKPKVTIRKFSWED